MTARGGSASRSLASRSAAARKGHVTRKRMATARMLDPETHGPEGSARGTERGDYSVAELMERIRANARPDQATGEAQNRGG
jgi:hypothetical protein